MCELPEKKESRLNLIPAERPQSLCPESLDGKRSHHAAVEHRAFQDFAIQLALRRDISHKPTRERIPRSLWIHHLFDRQRRRTKRMPPHAKRTLAEEDRRPIFAVLDDERLRSQRQHLLRCPRQVRYLRQHLRLAVSDQQHINQLQRLQ